MCVSLQMNILSFFFKSGYVNFEGDTSSILIVHQQIVTPIDTFVQCQLDLLNPTQLVLNFVLNCDVFILYRLDTSDCTHVVFVLYHLVPQQ